VNLANLPSESVYKTSTETLIKNRLQMLQESSSISQFEEKVGAGIVEELIEDAQGELALVDKMAQAKPWEPLEEAHDWTK
jgi:NADH dehydrogenase (ubiquinone) 1 alpha subcomplex subunit 5